MAKRIFYYIFLISLINAIFFISCTNSKPEITYGYLQLVIYQTDTRPREHFSFFIIPDDNDGLENLSELYLYHDREQLKWEIKSDEWVSYTQNARTWIGTRSISVREGSLPRGVYRAVLVNKGGERAERNFSFDGVIRFPFPEFIIEDGEYKINSLYPVNKLVCYDSSGNYSVTIELSSLSGSVSDLNLPSNVRTASLWADDEMNFCSAFTNAVPFN